MIKDSFPTSQANVEFGTGYNTVNLERTYNTAVEVSRGVNRGGYIECTYRIKLCKSRDEFLNSFSGGISASASYMGVEGSTSVKFLTETKITSLDSILVASVDAITDTEIATGATLTEEGEILLEKGKFEQFVEQYGTHYLRKIILGGRMILVMKFSSTSVEKKKELDSKLGVSTGTFGSEAEFAAKMHEIRESSSLEVSLYASGSNTEPPKPDVESCIQYAIDFAKSVLDFPTVREVEYAAVWTIPGTPDSFKRYLFPLQAKTDEIVGISCNLLDVYSALSDMLAQRDNDLRFFGDEAWDKVTDLQNQVRSMRLDLQNSFKVSRVSEFGDLITRYGGQGDKIWAEAEELAKQERVLDGSFVLRSSGADKYISTEVNGYPRLDSRAPVALNFRDTSGGEVQIGTSTSVLIQSVRSSKILCMGKNNWYVFWDSASYAGDAKCQWRLAHSTDHNKVTLEYGDKVILYNRFWPNYLMGVSDDQRWLGCVADTQAGNYLHQWVLERSQ